MLELIPFDDILDAIVEGDTLSIIAKRYNVPIKTFHDFLHATPERAAKYAQAKELSAEQLAEQGRNIIKSALHRDSGIDPQAAKALNDSLLKLAGMRNRAWRDNAQPVVAIQVNNGPLSLPDGADPQTAALTYSRLITQD